MSDGPITLRFLADHRLEELTTLSERTRKALRSKGVDNLLDLVTYYPRRWIDRSRQARIADLTVGEEAMVMVRIESISTRTTRNRKALTTARATDGSGRLTVTFFNQRWREKQLPPGTECILFGKVDTYRGARQMTSPLVDLVGSRTGRIVAVYPQSEKASLTSLDVEKAVSALFDKTRRRGLADPVPGHLVEHHGFIPRERALRAIHLPETMADVDRARRRLVFDELLRIQLTLVLRKRRWEQQAQGVEHRVTGPLTQAFHGSLPFVLTAAQERTIAEIDGDLAGRFPMHRLLQGDVGAGKTIVAVHALLVAVQGGHQGALMAPTEVLAEQHALGVRELLDGLTVTDPDNLFGERPLRVELLTNRITGKDREALMEGLARGEIDIVIGTHALIQEGVRFGSLGVAVIDEQHRFGVEQRAALKGKGVDPDVLVMTATPIPRTAAMTVYGDLDVSVLDELPPGRTPIVTTWTRTGGPADETDAAAAERAVWDTVRSEVAAGRQAYVVCPLIEESEKLEVSSAQDTWERLRSGELRDLEVGLLHGRVPPRERELTMELFRAGKIDVLVATTVIEVGVDVPNATVMVILDADRFGIAQLHQLRGRVGRGSDQSFCFLLGEGATPEGEARLQAMVRTTDGFELAEVDLELRGEGTIMGERQTGRNDLKLASLRRDREWVEKARAAAFELVDDDPDQRRWPDLWSELRLFIDDDEAEFLFKS